MYACVSCSTQIVKLLVSLKADESVCNKKGQTAFLLAASNGHDDILKFLDIGSYVDVADNRGWTPLMHAVAMAHVGTAKFLLQNGADVNAA